MGFFSRNLALKVIDWQDDTKNNIVYKYPMDGRKIFYGSKLTVRESQAAIFLNKGEIADIFEPGMYSLKTSTLPILSDLLGWPYGFKSPFMADVFFVNTKQFTNQKWGTTNPITMRDKDFGTIRIRAYGTYAFKVVNPGTFLKELFGTNSSFTTEDISNYLRSMLVAGISDTIAESKIGALDLASNLMEFNKMAINNIQSSFEKLGLSVTNCVIENISFPEAVEKAIDTRSSLGVLGDHMDTYVKYQSAEAIRDAAKNPGVAGFGTQMGTGIALGHVLQEGLKASAPQPTKIVEAKPSKKCPKCGTECRSNAKFCRECGTKFTAKEERFCPECGTKVAASAKFCGDCGTKLK